MANTLRFKRGLVSGIPTAALGEPLFTTDTFDLYIGNGTTNTRFQKYIASGATTQILRGDGSLYTFPLAISSPSAGQVLKYNGTSWVNDSDAGITGSGAAGQVAYFTGATTQSGSNNLFWDATNGRLGVGLNNPSVRLHVNGAIYNQTGFILNRSDNFGIFTGASDDFGILHNGTNSILSNATGDVIFENIGTQRARITSTGNFIINNASTDNGLRFQVTGDGYFSGSVGIGSTALTQYNLRVSKAITGSFPAGIWQDGVVQSTATNIIYGYINSLRTQAASFTISEYVHYAAEQYPLGAGSSVTTQVGFSVDNTLNGGTNNYAFRGSLTSGTGRWNLYMNGTAANYLAGDLSIGTTSPSPLVAGSRILEVSQAGDNFPAINISRTSGISYTNVTWRMFLASNANLHFRQNSTDRLILDASGNLGLGVTPSAWDSVYRVFQIGGNPALASQEAVQMVANGYYNAGWKYIANNYAARYEINKNNGGIHAWYNAPSGTAGNAITFTQAMTLDASGNLGIGTTSPSSVLNVLGTKTTALSTAADFLTLGLTVDDNTAFGNIGIGGGIAFRGRRNAGGVLTVYGAIDAGKETVLGDEYRGSLRFYTNQNSTGIPLERMRLDSSGNLGLGVTPSAWGSSTAIQIGSRASIASVISDINLSNNAFFNGTSWIYLTSTAATNYYQSAGEHVWRRGAGGTAGNAITWTIPMKLTDANNLLIGTTTDAGFRLDVNGTMRLSGASTFGSTLRINQTSNEIQQIINSSVSTNPSITQYQVGSSNGWEIGMANAANSYSYIFSYGAFGTGNAKFTLTSTGAATFSSGITAGGGVTASGLISGTSLKASSLQANTSDYNYLVFDNIASGYGDWNIYKSGANNLAIGFGTDGGATYTNAVTFLYGGGLSSNGRFAASGTGFASATSAEVSLTNTTASTGRQFVLNSANSGLFQIFDATAGNATRFTIDSAGAATFSSSVGVGVTPSVDLHLEKTSSPVFRIARTGGTILNISSSITATGAQISTGSASPIGFGINGVIAMTLDTSGNLGIATTPSYKLDVAGEARVSNAIAIGTTPDTNKPFKILKNINGTVGINFENTSTGSLAFSAIQMGTDVSGGTKFTNIVYSSSGVAQSGVYYPDGTSIINIGTGGLNFYSQGAPIRMFNGGGNGVLKWEMVNDSFINHYTGTAPTTSATDGYRQYSADVTAGNAAPHFRTENGAVIKLYQETTAVGNAIFSQGGGNSVLDDSTFDGYTLRQIVKALRNQGILQ